MLQRALALFFGAVIATLCGCGGGDGFPARVPVEVAVTYKGNPVTDAHVTFAPDDSTGKPAFGTTGPNGKVMLSTFGTDDGALPGSYQVAIRKFRVAKSKAVEADDPMAMPAGASMARPTRFDELLPKRYADAARSGLVATVTEGKGRNDFRFELTD